MTGFGRGTAELGDVSASVELRSVNNRFLEVSIRMPRSVSDREGEVQARVRQAFSRGRISVQIQLDEVPEDEPAIQVNPAAARAYRKLLDSLREAAGISEPVELSHLLTFSDIFSTEESDSNVSERLWAGLDQALGEAIRDLQRMRLDEGRALRTDLEARLSALEKELLAVQERAPERIGEARERLMQRLSDVLGDERVNRDRIEMEMVVYAEKLDVTEECVRLSSHVNLFREALESGESTGRRLNFLVQEMNREVNTIGSKANDAAIAHRAVAMKEELEKIREQVQNVE